MATCSHPIMEQYGPEVTEEWVDRALAEQSTLGVTKEKGSVLAKKNKIVSTDTFFGQIMDIMRGNKPKNNAKTAAAEPIPENAAHDCEASLSNESESAKIVHALDGKNENAVANLKAHL